MNLPKIETPKYTLTVPSTGAQLEFRPFLVKEEKILLMAQESDNNKELFKAIRDVIDACTFEKAKVSDLTNFDLEYIFLKLRAKSVGEISDITVKCKHCDAKNDITVNINEIEVVKNEELPEKIMLTDTVGIIPKYISASVMDSTIDTSNPSQALNYYIKSVIDSIFDDSKVYPISETSDADFEEFINSLNREQMKKIENIIENSPKLSKDVVFNCIKCKEENKITITGAESFF